MKNLTILILMFATSIFTPVFADMLNYTIKSEGTEMVIVPYSSTQPIIQKPMYKIEVEPSKIPFHTGKRLPVGKNKISFV